MTDVGLHLTLAPPGRSRAIDTFLPVSDLLVTHFVPGDLDDQLPVLVSIERVNSVIAALGFALADEGELDAIARTLTKQYLIVPPSQWGDSELRLGVDAPSDANEERALDAVSGLREPTLRAAPSIVHVSFDTRREAEARMTEALIANVERDKLAWTRLRKISDSFLARTVLATLIQEFIAVPAVDLIRSTLRGALRRVVD